MSDEVEEVLEDEAPARPVRGGRRRPPPRSKSVDDSGSLAQMRASRNGEKSSDNKEGEAERPRRGGRRAPARTKSADDMAAMSRMTRYARQKSNEENQTGEGGAEKKR